MKIEKRSNSFIFLKVRCFNNEGWSFLVLAIINDHTVPFYQKSLFCNRVFSLKVTIDLCIVGSGMERYFFIELIVSFTRDIVKTKILFLKIKIVF